MAINIAEGLFWALRLPLFGGVEVEDQQKPMGDSLSDGLNVRGGGWQTPFCMEIACGPLIAQSSAQDSNIQRFARTSALAKTLVFNVKKLLNEWRRPYVMAKEQKIAILVK